MTNNGIGIGNDNETNCLIVVPNNTATIMIAMQKPPHYLINLYDARNQDDDAPALIGIKWWSVGGNQYCTQVHTSVVSMYSDAYWPLTKFN